jgi:hypothetical protein
LVEVERVLDAGLTVKETKTEETPPRTGWLGEIVLDPSPDAIPPGGTRVRRVVERHAVDELIGRNRRETARTFASMVMNSWKPFTSVGCTSCLTAAVKGFLPPWLGVGAVVALR